MIKYKLEKVQVNITINIINSNIGLLVSLRVFDRRRIHLSGIAMLPLYPTFTHFTYTHTPNALTRKDLLERKISISHRAFLRNHFFAYWRWIDAWIKVSKSARPKQKLTHFGYSDYVWFVVFPAASSPTLSFNRSNRSGIKRSRQ